MKKNISFISLVIVCLTILASVGVFSYYTYHKEELKQEQQNERLEKEQKDRDYYRTQLTSCINNADVHRNNLWESNCPDDDKNCKLNTNVVDWIDSRYKQEVEECKMKWTFK